MSIQEESGTISTDFSSGPFETYQQGDSENNARCVSTIHESPARLRAHLARFSLESTDIGTFCEPENLPEYRNQRQRSCSDSVQDRKLRKKTVHGEKKTTGVNPNRIFRIQDLDNTQAAPPRRNSNTKSQKFKRQNSTTDDASHPSLTSLPSGMNTQKRPSDTSCRLKDTRLVVLGPGSVGKSSLVRQLVHGYFPASYHPTLQDSYSQLLQLPGGVFRKIEIVDTAGIYQFPAMRRLSIQSAHAFVVVYAVDNIETFNEAMNLVDLVRDVKSKQNSSEEQLDEGNTWPIMVVGNKSDLTTTRVIEKCYAEQKALDKRCIFIEASAKDNENVKQLFAELLLTFYGVESPIDLEHGQQCISPPDSKLQRKRGHVKCSIL